MKGRRFAAAASATLPGWISGVENLTQRGIGRVAPDADTPAMATAASPAAGDMVWHVLSDGAPLANVASYHDGAGVVVTAHFFATAGEAERIRPYRFEDSEAADSFVHDLVASFSYLGCHVSRGQR